tara:strand:+ start:294 stop:578 length:285 start_codon:yes stop_codon:yes gene_type:complete
MDTNGPWTWKQLTKHEDVLVGADGIEIDTRDRFGPHAPLLEAVPDLLEALTDLTDYTQTLMGNILSVEGGQARLDAGWDRISEAYKVIKKAKGE